MSDYAGGGCEWRPILPLDRMTADRDDPFSVLAGLWLGWSSPAAKCEGCGRHRKLYGRRRGERYCRGCHAALPIDGYTAALIRKYGGLGGDE
jgi:hypothetical protein